MRRESEAQPLVSVVTACHNALPFVGETIRSVLGQTYPAVEHVLVDDASTDGSREVLDGWAARFPGRVRPLGLEANGGPGRARNRGVEEARGEFLFFLDADDLATPDAVEALVEGARGLPGAVSFCDCRWWRRGPDGSWGDAPRAVSVPEEGTDLFRAFLERTHWPPTCSTLWSREAFELAGGFDEEMARDEDTDLLLRAVARGARLVRAAGGTGFYRTFGGTRPSVSSGACAARFRASVRVLDKLAAELDALGRLHDYAAPLARAYLTRAQYGFQQGYRELARDCVTRSERLAHAAPVSRHGGGRLVERVLGLERKEALADVLARVGISTGERRETARLQRALRAMEPSA